MCFSLRSVCGFCGDFRKLVLRQTINTRTKRLFISIVCFSYSLSLSLSVGACSTWRYIYSAGIRNSRKWTIYALKQSQFILSIFRLETCTEWNRLPLGGHPYVICQWHFFRAAPKWTKRQWRKNELAIFIHKEKKNYFSVQKRFFFGDAFDNSLMEHNTHAKPHWTNTCQPKKNWNIAENAFLCGKKNFI